METSAVDHELLLRHKPLLSSLSQMERITLLADAIEVLKGRPYEKADYKCSPKYDVGDEVVVLSNYYYFAEIRGVGAFVCPVLNKSIPCYEVIYRDWSAPEPGREEVAEYDVMAMCGPDYKPVEIFMAYHWNKLKRCSKLPKAKRSGVFNLDSAGLKTLEQQLDTKFCHGFDDTGFGSFKDWFNC